MTVSYKYGRQKVDLPIPEQARHLHIKDPDHVVSEQTFVQGLDRLIADRTKSGTVAIVIADKTRLCGYNQILPWLVTALNRKGISDDQITFYIAYGTHPRQTDEECLSAYGQLYNNYRFVHHDCSQTDCFEKRGTTSRGTAVMVRRDVLCSDLIITVGAISHHYFAGYGGGRKLLFPGLAAKEAIYANHRLFLDKEKMVLAAGCWPGNVADNPLAEDLKEIHDMLPEYLSIHAVLDSRGDAAQYHFGSSYEAFLDVCKELDRFYKIKVDERFDLVVASAGGYPKDINMVQTHKTVHHAANLVRDGGTLIVLAECVDGVGSKTFLPYFDMGGREDAFAELVQDYVGNGGTALAMMEKTNRITICLVTTLPVHICEKIGVKKLSLDQAADLVGNHSGSIAAVPNGSMLITDRIVSEK